jgi:hypothetical protein
MNLRYRRLLAHVRLGRAIRYNPTEVALALRKLTVEDNDDNQMNDDDAPPRSLEVIDAHSD